jgi:hypothetical protein
LFVCFLYVCCCFFGKALDIFPKSKFACILWSLNL